MGPTSKSLLLRARDGDGEARSRLVVLYRPMVYAALRRCGLQDADAEDLAQVVMVRVLSRLASFDHSGRTGAFRKWLWTIAVRCAAELRRKEEGRAVAAGGSDHGQCIEQLQDPNSELSHLFEDELIQQQREALRRLQGQVAQQFQQKTFDAFRMRVHDRLPSREVAAILGMTAAAVDAATSRVLKRLREEAEGLFDLD